MAIEINVPRLGWTMDEGVFVEWLKQDGERVEVGEPLFALEDEKATQEVESIDSGILRIPKDGPREGDTVAVGDVLGYLVEPGETISLEGKTRPAAAAEQNGNGVEIHSDSSASATDSVKPSHVVTPVSAKVSTISPRAAKVAAELRVDWTQLQGSGRNGRIREQDVRAAAQQNVSARSTAPVASPSNANPTRILPISRIRRTIANRMVHSVQTTAPVTLMASVDATNLVNLRGQFQSKGSSEAGFIPSYSDLIVKLVSVVLRDHPLLNARWTEEHIVLSEEVHVALAVDTEAGLLVPVIRDVPSLTLEQLVAKSRDLTTRARSNRLSSDELKGGTFTVTNLGSYGVDTFTPIIDSPQSAILGVGAIARQPVVYKDQIVARDKMSLSLTFDHRIVDGAPAARFFSALRNAVENPVPCMISSRAG